MPHLRSLRPNASVLDIYRLDMELARLLLRYQQQLLRGPSPLSVQERELIGAFVSGLNACQFCAGVHGAVAARFGVDPDLLKSLLDGGRVDSLPAKFGPLLAYLRKLTLMPAKMVKADADAVYAAGWNETALYHAVSICALFNFFNRLVDGVGLDAAVTDFDAIAKGLHEIGYEGRL
jgi:uncharacterized peroxidase-related enzyme